MKFIRTFALIIATLLLGTGISRAQFNTPDAGGSFTLNFIGTMPMGDFAETSYVPTLIAPSVYAFNGCGNATFGGSLGFKAGYQFGFGLGIFVTADAMWNQLNKDMRVSYNNRSKTKPNYINFPIMLALDYKCYFGDVFGLYAEGGAGSGLLFTTPEGWSDNMTEYKLSAAFAWEGGLGILLGEHFSLGVHYYMCGNHHIEMKDPPLYITPNVQNVGILALKLGLIF